ncbi:Similar to hypothetical protein [Tuber melanosporum Mel28]; acc. no. XP_002836363 [Pyronema omphalodes CBS 100304]|uniref:Uncharacterized protein n=1 Tax=Pyronema omphalodes (strain CBS 100304) TaxID=1076935 RepID=U4L0D6_PYROM|nr:Similar to hypothetical protein [Tuber melanosporum Mel28]; acc. no. XP_002836363 [Pyronema omphalodes CBS 100304]
MLNTPQTNNSTQDSQIDKFYAKMERPTKITKTTKKDSIPKDNIRIFEGHLEKRKPPTEFRCQFALGNSSLLARRFRKNGTQLLASTSGLLTPPSYPEVIDLITPDVMSSQSPPEKIDSGYLSYFNTPRRSPEGLNECSQTNTPAPPPKPDTATPNGDKPTNIPGYKASMLQRTEEIYHKRFLKENFTFNPEEAREQLKPAMRIALDRMEDRPLVDKFYLRLNFKARTIRGEKRTERFRYRIGKRPSDQRCRNEWESRDYLSARYLPQS